MTLTQRLLTILAVILATQLVRWLPFMLLRSSRPMPPFLTYLSPLLPPIAFAMLAVYCFQHSLASLPSSLGLFFRNTSSATTLFSNLYTTFIPYLPEALAALLVVLLQARFRNMALTILTSTAAYVLLQHALSQHILF